MVAGCASVERFRLYEICDVLRPVRNSTQSRPWAVQGSRIGTTREEIYREGYDFQSYRITLA